MKIRKVTMRPIKLITGSIESGGLNGYRLMCFEHQECAGPFSIYESAGREDIWSTSFLRYKVSIVDNTLSIYESIVNNYKKLIDGEFEDYYQTATEQCSYNNTDGFFNDFFITGATESYSDSPHMAPWYLMPIVYYMHRELVFNEFNGDMTALYWTDRYPPIRHGDASVPISIVSPVRVYSW